MTWDAEAWGAATNESWLEMINHVIIYNSCYSWGFCTRTMLTSSQEGDYYSRDDEEQTYAILSFPFQLEITFFLCL